MSPNLEPAMESCFQMHSRKTSTGTISKMNDQPRLWDWNALRKQGRGCHAARYDDAGAKEYAAIPGMGYLLPDQLAAHRADLADGMQVEAGLEILEVGAGTGAFTEVLAHFPGARVTATEPSPAMIRSWRDRMDLAGLTNSGIEIHEGSCDAPEDRSMFKDHQFDLVACRKVVNGLFDPLAAFANWYAWLKPGGRVLVLDAIFGRDGWGGAWGELVDVLPLSSTQSLGTIPYLLEAVGFEIEHVGWMHRVNALPSTRTPRYVVVASR
jgi:SAM-dependent methyltransferase